MADKKSRSRSVTPGAKGDIAVGSGANSSTLLSVGTDGQVLTADAASTGGVKWGSAGINWTSRLTTGYQFNAIAWNGSNLYVAAGSTGTLYSSTDGTTWTSRTSGFGTNSIQDVAYGNGLFVAVGANGTITTSTDGTTWTARTSNMSTNTIQAVIYANSLWVAVGTGGGTTNTGGITYSTDGTTWSRKSQSLTNVSTTYYDVAWNGTNWIVGTADSGTYNFIYATAPSGTWTGAASGSGQDIKVVICDGTKTLFSTTGATISNSWKDNALPTSTLQFAAVQACNGKNTIQLYNNRYYWVYTSLFSFSNTLVTTSGGSELTTADVNLISALVPSFSNSSLTSTASSATSLLITSSGYIIGDSYGRIWTSF